MTTRSSIESGRWGWISRARSLAAGSAGAVVTVMLDIASPFSRDRVRRLRWGPGLRGCPAAATRRPPRLDTRPTPPIAYTLCTSIASAERRDPRDADRIAAGPRRGHRRPVSRPASAGAAPADHRGDRGGAPPEAARPAQRRAAARPELPRAVPDRRQA